MPEITAANMAALNVSFKASFQKGLELAKPEFTEIASVIPSTGNSNMYPWLGHTEGMTEWVGSRTVQEFKAHTYSIVNKDFQETVKVKRTHIEDDEMGTYGARFEMLGESAALFPTEIVFSRLASGKAEDCYDGQYFFDTDHPVGGETVSNFTDGTGPVWYVLDCSRSIKPLIWQERKKPELIKKDKSTDDNVFWDNEFVYGTDLRGNAGFGFWQMAHMSKADLSIEEFAKVYAHMRKLKTEKSRPLNITPTHLVCSPDLEFTALSLFADKLPGGATNPYAGRMKVISSPWVEEV